MKYLVRIICIFILTMNISSAIVYAQDNSSSILQSQQENLNISSFLKESKKYTENVLTDLEIGDIFNSALTGKIDNNKILGKILNIFGKEVKESITTLRNSFGSNYNT